MDPFHEGHINHEAAIDREASNRYERRHVVPALVPDDQSGSGDVDGRERVDAEIGQLDLAVEPLAQGMQAAVPHTDWLLAGNSLASLEELAVLMEEM